MCEIIMEMWFELELCSIYIELQNKRMKIDICLRKIIERFYLVNFV
jgi:hypothetical protein